MLHGHSHTVSDRFIISTQYFLYFGVLGVFLPFFNLYCYHIGFDGFQIGVLNATRSLVMVAFSIFWSIIADRYRMRRRIYLLCNLVSTVVWSFYLFHLDFLTVLLITVVHVIFHAPIIAFLEAFSMDVLGKDKNRYGHVRVWGSLSFIVTVSAVGYVTRYYPVEVILIFITAGATLQTITATRMPAVKSVSAINFRSLPELFIHRRFSIFLFCAFLMLVSHGTYYGFYSIHLEKLGYDRSFIGFSWALASISEIVVMMNSQRIFKRFPIEKVLLFSFVIATLRWTILSVAQSAIALVFSQLFHAITYGTFHIASILYIDRLTPEKGKTVGQSINNAVTYGIGMMVGFFFNGYFYDRAGAFTLFLLSGLISATAGTLFFFGTRGYRKNDEPVEKML